jgi:hypothetical protein
MIMERARRCLFAKSFKLIIADDKSLSIQGVVNNKLDKVNWRVSHMPRGSLVGYAPEKRYVPDRTLACSRDPRPDQGIRRPD